MGRTKWNPAAGDSGALGCRARRLDGPNHSANRRALQASARVDELLFRLTDRLRRPGLTDFEAGFCKSLLRQAKRGGPRWQPSDRQRAVADKILAERNDEPEESLIEEEGLPDDWPF